MKQTTHSLFSTPILIGCVVFLLLIGLTPYFYSIATTQSTAHPVLARGIIVGNMDVHGMDEDTLRSTLEDLQQKITDSGIRSTFDQKTSILHEPIAPNPDIPAEQNTRIIAIDIDTTVRSAFSFGRSSSPLDNAIEQTKLLIAKHQIPIAVSINRELLSKSLENAFPNALHAATQADFKYNTVSGTFDITKEQSGTTFDIDSAVNIIAQSVGGGLTPTLLIQTIEQPPSIVSSDITKLIPVAQKLVRPITMTTDATHSWKLDAKVVAQLITADRKTSGEIGVSIRIDTVKKYLEETVAPAVLIEGKDPRFEVQDGKVLITTQPQNGKKLKIDESIALLTGAILDGVTSSISLPVKESVSAALDIPSQESIKEIVAQAVTDFRSSPKNRKLNIANGISRINGILIQPKEEFSLLKHLEPIDASTGFLPELVIKGKETKPDFGGGLCQVSTTLFRAVAYAGLPVTMRRNHSYRVSYYEPPVGFDATIYSPGPDFKFINDMTTPLLVQATVKGTKVTVTFWGTKDGRTSEVDKPTVTNIKKPTETKLIETTDLKPGEKKCTEKAHAGADAYFERRVTYPSGEVKKDMFKSHYVVWPAVCYIGKEEPKPEPVVPNETTPPTAPIEN